MANKLELTWYGKDEPIRVEPRLLIENPALSNVGSDTDTGNMLIHGDNLLALKALESKYTGQIKCIYIDPPYNTGAAFEHYDDNMEHSIWLRLMKVRLEILRNLLAPEGAICVQIDATEIAYLKVLMDEIFTRKNFINMISVKTKIAGVSGSNMGKSLQDNIEYILMYARDKNCLRLNPIYVKQKLFLRIKSYELEGKSWKYISVLSKLGDKVLLKEDSEHGMTYYGYRTMETMSIAAFARANNISEEDVYSNYADRIFQTTNAQSSVRQTVMNEAKDFDYPMIGLEYVPIKGKNAGKRIEILYKGNQRRMMMFLSDSVEEENGEYFYLDKINTLWNDIQYNNLTKEGNVQFPNGKKPESLIGRIIKMLSFEGDVVLDSFLGSGTTAATAHKLKRRWIGIEFGDHCYTHCIPRLNNVIDGTDSGGITESVGWQGGGGFRFYELASSLINEDPFGELVINDKYDADMLAAAVALHEGFTYQPSEGLFWKQSVGNENSYLFVTTRHLNSAYLDSIKDTMEDGEYLVIACRSFDSGLEKAYPGITIKKIPQMLLNRCEFGKADYNLNIVHPPVYEDEEDCDE